MKRRHFINGIAALSGTLLLAPIAVKAADTKPFDETQLFIRFFQTATGHRPFVHQIEWFKSFKTMKPGMFRGPRQCGMTTFMCVLALYESKVHQKNVQITPTNWTTGCLIETRLNAMRWNVGKHISDGNVDVGMYAIKANGEVDTYDMQFNMDDDPGLRPGNKYSENVYSFATREKRYI